MKSLNTLRRTASAAFTLMEMMLVLGIIAVLIAIGAVTLSDVGGSGDVIAARAQISTIKTGLISYKALNRRLPTQAEGLEVLTTSGGGKRKVMEESGIVDPWGSKYQYRNPGKKDGSAYDVFSMGPDMKEGTADDIYPQ